ncbi:MAG: SDR family oxidoreductase [Rhodospirillales bacterium]|jgi:NAD(P)-dependent dehydrogenase (short-subunit alcohol dehydrogenase family)|nr:SDR family oxidoreductase [Rhodospirillales bacterium]
MSAELTFTDGVAVVTGGGTGIGYAVAECFVNAGIKTVITGLPRDQENLEKACADFGPLAVSRISDVTDVDAHADFVEDIESTVGPIDFLINNAGRHLKKQSYDTTKAELDAVIETNLSAIFMFTGACVKKMRIRKRGSIIMMSSMTGLMGMPIVPVYSLTKTALIGLTRSLAVDYGPDGIRVNAICPGFIDTPMFRQAMEGDPARFEKIVSRISLGETGQPSDVGNAILFLCSEQARYLTGLQLPIDGGYVVGF